METDWPAYHRITAERPPWGTTVRAAATFEAEGPAARVAVDLGCAAGRDTLELLRRGWRVIAVDREADALDTIIAAEPADVRPRLEPVVADA